jgi:hypothetical protein
MRVKDINNAQRIGKLYIIIHYLSYCTKPALYLVFICTVQYRQDGGGESDRGLLKIQKQIYSANE